TGEAQAVELWMSQSMLASNDVVSSQLTGANPPHGFRAGQNWSPIFTLAIGRKVNITLDSTTNGGFQTWCKAMDRPDLAEDPRFADIIDRVRHRAELEAEIAPWVARFEDAAALEAAIGVSTVLAAEVRTPAELAETRWAEERGAFVDVDTGRGETVRVPQSPWRFRGAEAGVK